MRKINLLKLINHENHPLHFSIITQGFVLKHFFPYIINALGFEYLI